MSNPAFLLKAENIHKSYPQGSGELHILKGVHLEIQPGEAIGIVGPSGSGKSTFLQILGTLDRPQSGSLFFGDRDVLKMSEEEVAKFRSDTMGFVFQFHYLISELNALENVLLPCRIANDNLVDAKIHAQELLDKLGLKDRAHHYPTELSGGELQRVAIARALIRKPKILFADEPTGNLDSVNSQMIQDLFFELKESLGLTVVVVTHDLQFASRFARCLRMKDGQWVS